MNLLKFGITLIIIFIFIAVTDLKNEVIENMKVYVEKMKTWTLTWFIGTEVMEAFENKANGTSELSRKEACG